MTWQLLRVWHAEVLSTVARSPTAHHFTRTSYVLAPAGWLKLDPDELRRRVEFLLHSSYKRRNHLAASSGDPAEMWLICYAFEWVARAAMPADLARNADQHIWIMGEPFAAELVEAAVRDVERQWRQARPGIDERPWTDGFSLISIEADGENWKLLRSHDADSFAKFEDALRPPTSAAAAQ